MNLGSFGYHDGVNSDDVRSASISYFQDFFHFHILLALFLFLVAVFRSEALKATPIYLLVHRNITKDVLQKGSSGFAVVRGKKTTHYIHFFFFLLLLLFYFFECANSRKTTEVHKYG